ncbi:hypothetical protein MPDQ_006754 [Monascus purpureus]|uniref:J domain-containing protein n=1 Tax=Monascus purpureus TaxID=5098 RepID=A0A507QTN7_MONPU|nr:hypothetical protein MPDQ_006754 [Monascus purpureus]BDD60475.1 hypothetical protein MAP00_005600 [Monascus purpureus]
MSSILSYIGWAVLPNYATSILQNIYYGITIRAGDPRPQPPSPRYYRHRRRIFILVITSYLLYTLYDAFYQIQLRGDFYRVLGVSPLSDNRTVKSRFRLLATMHHPDKLAHTDSAEGADQYFVFLKMAQDTILDPTKRFAYDRFGPDIVGWNDRKTMQDFVYGSLKTLAVQYIGGFLTMVILNFVWWSDWGRYWRFYTFFALITLELFLITHPRALFVPDALLPEGLRNLLHISVDQPSFYLLPFQISALARRVSVTLHIFISQIAPTGASKTSMEQLSPQTVQCLGQLMQLARATDAEATRLVQLGFAPFRGDRQSVNALRKGMKEGLVLSSVKASPEVQRAVAQVVEHGKKKNGEAD